MNRRNLSRCLLCFALVGAVVVLHGFAVRAISPGQAAPSPAAASDLQPLALSGLLEAEVGQTVTFRVTSDGRVLAGAVVQTTGQSQTSTWDGSVAFTFPAAGTYPITATKTGYLTATHSIVITPTLSFAQVISGTEVTIRDAELITPTLIANATVTFTNVTYPGYPWYPPALRTLLRVVSSTLIFSPPYPDTFWPLGSHRSDVRVEDSQVIFRGDISESVELWPFTYARGAHILFEGAFEPSGLSVSPDAFYGWNTFEFTHPRQPGWDEGVNNRFIHRDVGWDRLHELRVTDNNHLLIYHSKIGDLRVWDEAVLHYADSTPIDTTYIRDHSSGFITHTIGSGGIELFGDSRLSLADSDLSGLDVYGTSQATVENSPLAHLIVGDQGQARVMTGTQNSALIVGDRAFLRVEGVRMEAGRVAAFGSASLELSNVTMTGMAYGELRAYDSAVVTVTDSIIDKVYVFDDATLNLQNSTIGQLYYAATVDGPASVSSEVITGSVRLPTVAVDATSQVTETRLGHVFVTPSGTLTVTNSSWLDLLDTGIYVYGDARFVDSGINNLMVYGPASRVELQNSHVDVLYTSVHVTGTAEISGTEVAGAAAVVGVQPDISSTVGITRVGLIHTHDGASLQARGVQIEGLVAEGDGELTVEGGQVGSIRIGGQVTATLSGLSDETDFGYPPLPMSRGKLAFGSPIFSPGASSWLEVFDQARVTLTRVANSDSVEVYGQGELVVAPSDLNQPTARIGMVYEQGHLFLEPSQGFHFLLAFDEGQVTLNQGITSFDTLVLDRASAVFNCGFSQDYYFGRKNDTHANGLILSVRPDGPHEPSSGCDPPVPGDYSLSGVVGMYVMGTVHDERWDQPAMQRSRLQEVLLHVDGEPLEPDPGAFNQFWWNTRLVRNGTHTLRVVARDGEGHENVLETAVEVRNVACYDFSGDDQVDTADIQAVAACWHLTVSDPNCEAVFDIDEDGVINVVDVMRVAAQWGRPCP